MEASKSPCRCVIVTGQKNGQASALNGLEFFFFRLSIGVWKALGVEILSTGIAI